MKIVTPEEAKQIMCGKNFEKILHEIQDVTRFINAINSDIKFRSSLGYDSLEFYFSDLNSNGYVRTELRKRGLHKEMTDTIYKVVKVLKDAGYKVKYTGINYYVIEIYWGKSFLEKLKEEVMDFFDIL